MSYRLQHEFIFRGPPKNVQRIKAYISRTLPLTQRSGNKESLGIFRGLAKNGSPAQREYAKQVLTKGQKVFDFDKIIRVPKGDHPAAYWGVDHGGYGLEVLEERPGYIHLVFGAHGLADRILYALGTMFPNVEIGMRALDPVGNFVATGKAKNGKATLVIKALDRPIEPGFVGASPKKKRNKNRAAQKQKGLKRKKLR